MKKFLLILVVLSLIGCSSPVDEPDVGEPVVLTFEEAVQEVYEMTGKTLFFSTNGDTLNSNIINRASGSNEKPGVCTDYAIEFAYYWNEVKNYDEVYGKAYFAWTPTNDTFLYIADVSFKPDGTSKIREQSGDFGINANQEEMDGVYRDTTVNSFKYIGSKISHFNKDSDNHMWVVIKINDDWYDCEPTWWDSTFTNNYIPYKLSLQNGIFLSTSHTSD